MKLEDKHTYIFNFQRKYGSEEFIIKNIVIKKKVKNLNVALKLIMKCSYTISLQSIYITMNIRQSLMITL